MSANSCNKAFEGQGFRPLAQMSFLSDIEAWWHAGEFIEITALSLDGGLVLKGSKSYYLQSISAEGRLWARDLGPLQEYLEDHFPELRISFAYYRDISKSLVMKHLEQSGQLDSVEPERVFHGDLELANKRLQSNSLLAGLDSGSSSLLQSHFRREASSGKQHVRQITRDLKRRAERGRLLGTLQQEYLQKASAASFTFQVSSNLYLCFDETETLDALINIRKELADHHKYRVHQKLSGGRLNVQAVEAKDPRLTWLETWLGGGLTPRQLDEIESHAPGLVEVQQEHLMVLPDQDIRVEGHVQEDKKRVAARVVSGFLNRLDDSGSPASPMADYGPESLPLCLGLLADQGASKQPAIFPLAKFNNLYISGSTGSGKSYLGRVVLEEAAQHEIFILVLDPRNQAAGMLMPEDRSSILSLYAQFGMKPRHAKGFKMDYFAPGNGLGKELPADLGILGTGRSIVSFRGLDDRERCLLFAKILDAVFDQYATEESASIKLLLFVEEAQRFTKKRVGENAKSAGLQAENALDRTVREGRKYGCCTVIVSQTIRDFAYDTASVRQNTNTKAFLHNSDREVDYAATFLGDGKQIIQLEPGTALLHNAAWGSAKVRVRPPHSKVWELSPNDTRQLVCGEAKPLANLTNEAEELLGLARSHADEHGEGLHLNEAAKLLGITSKRKLGLVVAELEAAALLRTIKLRQRGQPRVLVPISSTNPGLKPDETGREA